MQDPEHQLILAVRCVQVNPRKEKPVQGIKSLAPSQSESSHCVHVVFANFWLRICNLPHRYLHCEGHDLGECYPK